MEESYFGTRFWSSNPQKRTSVVPSEAAELLGSGTTAWMKTLRVQPVDVLYVNLNAWESSESVKPVWHQDRRKYAGKKK